jgi:hypothetical protein
MQNTDEQILHDLFEESNSELDDLFFDEHDETYDHVPTTTLEMNQEQEDGHPVYSSSTQTSDCGEEFDLNPIPCNGNDALNMFHQEQLRAVSPGSGSTESSVTPNHMMAKLAECMERSAISRSLVETFCQSLKASASQENIQQGGTTSMAMKKSKGRIQDNKISVVKASASRSAKKHKMGSFLRNKSKNQKPSSSVSTLSKKNDDLLIAKFKCLESGNQDDGNHRIASFLRREKLNSLVLQLSPQVA